MSAAPPRLAPQRARFPRAAHAPASPALLTRRCVRYPSYSPRGEKIHAVFVCLGLTLLGLAMTLISIPICRWACKRQCGK